MAGDVLYIGIDLGTFRSVMVSSDSHEEEELTVIGTPKEGNTGGITRLIFSGNFTFNRSD